MYYSMKRVVHESDRLIEISLMDNEQGWKTLQMDELCTMSFRSTGTIL
jgi:hypothetical protein